MGVGRAVPTDTEPRRSQSLSPGAALPRTVPRAELTFTRTEESGAHCFDLVPGRTMPGFLDDLTRASHRASEAGLVAVSGQARPALRHSCLGGPGTVL